MAATTPTDDDTTRREWWHRRRLAFNVGLVASGIGAFVCYAAVLALIPEGTVLATGEPPEITIFTTGFQAAGYLVAMLAANVCYELGPLAERLVQPANAPGFRRRTFALGLAFSMALPFAIPVIAYVRWC